MRAAITSSCEKIKGSLPGVGRTFGGSRAEKAEVRTHMVHALSGVGSSWVVLASYAYEYRIVTKVR